MTDQIARIIPADASREITTFEANTPLTIKMPHINNLNKKLDANTKIFTAGSCFADNIAQSLFHYGLRAVGPHYNNESFRNSLGTKKDWLFCTLPENNPHITSYTHTAFDPLQLYQDLKFGLDLLTGKNLPISSFPILKSSNPYYERLGYKLDYMTPLMSKCWAKEPKTIHKMHKQIYASIAYSLLKSDVYILTYGVAEYIKINGTDLYACNSGLKKLENLGTAGILDVAEATHAISGTIEIINKINNDAIIFVSLSPVRLGQTQEKSKNFCNIYQMGYLGKSILRVAIDSAIKRRNDKGQKNVFYIPSYEYVCLNGAYDSDKRHVNRTAVDKIINCFTESYFELN